MTTKTELGRQLAFPGIPLMVSSGTYSLLDRRDDADPSIMPANYNLDEVQETESRIAKSFILSSFACLSCLPMVLKLKSKLELSDDERSDAYGWRGPY